MLLAALPGALPICPPVGGATCSVLHWFNRTASHTLPPLPCTPLQDFFNNFASDPTVKIPWVRRDLCGSKMLVMEWIDGIRCTDPAAIRNSSVDVDEFIRCGVVSGLRQLLEFGLFHGDPHPGNIFALRDGRIAYVDFGNVAELSARNKAILIDAVVHAVNEDYREMAGGHRGGARAEVLRCMSLQLLWHLAWRAPARCTLPLQA